MAHRCNNSQAEHANVEVLQGLQTSSFKKKLEACGKGALDKLQSVLWSIHTSTTKPTGETAFFLSYRSVAVIPVELKYGSLRVLVFDEAHQAHSREADLLFLEEARRLATFHTARYQHALRRYHKCHIHPRTLEVGDLILSRVLSREGLHKLSTMCEGPFRIAHVSKSSAARVETEGGSTVANTWNIQHLWRFYP